MTFIALDIGSGLVKYGNEDGRFADMMSSVGQLNQSNTYLMGIDDHQRIECDRKTYLTGLAAINNIPESQRVKTTKGLWCEDEHQKILFYSVVAELFPDGYTGNIQIVAGLPVSRFAKHNKTHKALFVGNHKFSTNRSRFDITITEDQCIVLPQVIGLYFTYLARDKDAIKTGHIGFVDPGTHTTGYSCVSEGAYNSLRSADGDSLGADVGLIKLAHAVKDELKEVHNYEGETTEILKGLRDGYISIFDNGKSAKLDLKQIASRQVPKVYGKLVTEMQQKWKGGKTMRVFVGGGGGEYILEYIKQTFPHAALLKSTKRQDQMHPIFDVVYGYHAYGKALFANQSENKVRKTGTA